MVNASLLRPFASQCSTCRSRVRGQWFILRIGGICGSRTGHRRYQARQLFIASPDLAPIETTYFFCDRETDEVIEESPSRCAISLACSKIDRGKRSGKSRCRLYSRVISVAFYRKHCQSPGLCGGKRRTTPAPIRKVFWMLVKRPPFTMSKNPMSQIALLQPGNTVGFLPLRT